MRGSFNTEQDAAIVHKVCCGSKGQVWENPNNARSQMSGAARPARPARAADKPVADVKTPAAHSEQRPTAARAAGAPQTPRPLPLAA